MLAGHRRGAPTPLALSMSAISTHQLHVDRKLRRVLLRRDCEKSTQGHERQTENKASRETI